MTHKLIIITVTIVLGFSISLAVNDAKANGKTKKRASYEKGEFYRFKGPQSMGDKLLEIVTVRDHEYVILHKGYGSDLEHFAGCTNQVCVAK
jgi:hypothetical protein